MDSISKWIGEFPITTTPGLLLGLAALAALVAISHRVGFRSSAAAAGSTSSDPGGLGRDFSFMVKNLFFVVAFLSLVIWIISLQSRGPETTLPLLAVLGILVLLVALSLISFLYGKLNLADATQALALPRGSVRAVIALSLIVLFAILAIYLHGSIARGGKVVREDMTESQLTAFQSGMPIGQITVVRPALAPAGGSTPASAGSTPAGAGSTPAGAGSTPADAGKVTVFYREASNPVADDLAKHLLIVMGTLVTAVASFYFGSNSVASAISALKPGLERLPWIGKLEPSTLEQGATDKPFIVSGRLLSNVTEVRLEKDDRVLKLQSDLKASAGQVSGKLTIPNDAPIGFWDVVIFDGSLPITEYGAFEVKPKGKVQDQQPTKTAAVLRKADPEPIMLNDSEQEFKLLGDQLDSVTKVVIQQAQQSDQELKIGHRDASELKLSGIVPTSWSSGEATIVATGTGKPASLKVTLK